MQYHVHYTPPTGHTVEIGLDDALAVIRQWPAVGVHTIVVRRSETGRSLASAKEAGAPSSVTPASTLDGAA